MKELRMKAIALVLTLAPLGALADEVCETSAPMSAQRLLRRMSLDLRGRVPDAAEIAAQRGADEVDVDAMLRSPELLEVMRRYHAELLWPNIDQLEIVPAQNVLMGVEVAPGDVLYLSPLRSVFLRTISGPLYGLCRNEPARFDAEGRIIAEPVYSGAGEILSYQEGYVMVEPWWAPGTQIKVCGFDAQPALRAVACPGPSERYPFMSPTCEGLTSFAASLEVPFTGDELACNSAFALFAPGCGCGPNLRYCQTDETLATLRRSLLEQELRVVERVIAEDRPYHEILTALGVEMNGPIAHFLTHQTLLQNDIFGDLDDSSPVAPGLEGHEVDRWVSVTRGGRHAGVLTTPGYLLRFGANRGRAHRFYNAFECSSFIPAGTLPSPSEPCSQHEDLTKRCGCDACHQSLEPMAAAWGRFAEYGFGVIDDQKYPPRFGGGCTPPFTDLRQVFVCLKFYETEPVGEEEPYRLMLNSYVFRTPEEVEIIETGPRAIAERAVASGSFDTCTVRRIWTHFMRRPPTAEEEATVVPELRRALADNGHSLRALVRAVVTQPAYRRIP